MDRAFVCCQWDRGNERLNLFWGQENNFSARSRRRFYFPRLDGQFDLLFIPQKNRKRLSASKSDIWRLALKFS